MGKLREAMSEFSVICRTLSFTVRPLSAACRNHLHLQPRFTQFSHLSLGLVAVVLGRLKEVGPSFSDKVNSDFQGLGSSPAAPEAAGGAGGGRRPGFIHAKSENSFAPFFKEEDSGVLKTKIGQYV